MNAAVYPMQWLVSTSLTPWVVQISPRVSHPRHTHTQYRFRGSQLIKHFQLQTLTHWLCTAMECRWPKRRLVFTHMYWYLWNLKCNMCCIGEGGGDSSKNVMRKLQLLTLHDRQLLGSIPKILFCSILQFTTAWPYSQPSCSGPTWKVGLQACCHIDLIELTRW